MTYTDVFGSATLPPSEYGYASFTLTTNTTLVWPYNTDGSPHPVAKVMDIACDTGNEVTLPDCTEVSTGEDFLIRNVGANVLVVKDAAGVQVASVAVGAASYFYLTDNTSAAGVFGVIGFGVGTSTADASSLVGYGIKAVGASLNQAHPVQPINTGITISTDHRAKLIVFTGGVATFTLDSAGTLGDDYFTMFRNDGTGTATIDPAASELIDGMTSMQVQPGESLMLICTGTKWYSVGYGRSTLYQFTQLTKDVSAGGTITLSATEAANKLITFIGNPSAAVEVVVPAVVAVYYTQSAISTAQTITLKTSAGSGVGISQGSRVIALCDGTNVVSAQSAVANTSVSLTDGSALVPSLFFATQTNTGLFKSGTQDVGVTIGGSAVAVFGSTGLQTTTIGPNSTQRHTLPAVPSDTVTLNTATQTLTDKTISVDNNTISGVAVSSFVLSNSSGNIDGSAAQKAVPTGVVVGTTDTQTLTNKTLTAPVINSPTGIVKGDVGLGNVDNTSDADKPVSTAAQAALNLKADAASPTTTGTLTHSGNIVLSGSGRRITGDFSNATVANRVMFQTSTVNGNTTIGAIPNGTATAAEFRAYSESGLANGAVAGFQQNSTDLRIFTGVYGSGTYLPMTFYTGGSERMRIDTSGNVGIGTSSPLGKLHIETPSGTATRVRWYQTGVTNYEWQIPASTDAFALVYGGSTERMRIDSSGNVGIGTSSSGAKLDVAISSGGLVQQLRGTSGVYTRLGTDSSSFYTVHNGTTDTFMYTQESAALRFGTAATERMRIDSSGNLLVGTTSLPASNWSNSFQTNRGSGVWSGGFVSQDRGIIVRQTANGSGYMAYFEVNNGGTAVGSISNTNTNVAYNTTSDYRLKENIQPMQNALSVVQQLNPVTYTWKADGSEGQGFIAHELQAVVPDCVTGEKDAVDADGNPVYQGIDTSFLVATLVAAIQELKSDFDAYKATHP